MDLPSRRARSFVQVICGWTWHPELAIGAGDDNIQSGLDGDVAD